ncbi:MAG: PEP-CTERM sorting domain-containing protein [Phycisphaerales bacterium]|nr:PEP-CTERM sorting domain-containing protein [Phycisphaerales bacterium]
MNSATRSSTLAITAAGIAALASHAAADTWNVNMTVDNQFDAYSGTASAAITLQGSGNSWSTVYPFTVTGMTSADYFYVATASDHNGAQGFLGDFTNTTTNQSFNTGSPVWGVFPVGAYLQQIDSSWPSTWPSLLMPTQSQVNQALAFAAANPSVWITPATYSNWDNRVSGNITTWGHRAGIDASSQWIWNNVTGGNPFTPGFNHDEFLIFRVPGVPAPGSFALLGFGGLAICRRRRA